MVFGAGRGDVIPAVDVQAVESQVSVRLHADHLMVCEGSAWVTRCPPGLPAGCRPGRGPGWAEAPRHLSRQGPEILRWVVYEVGKTHARASAPGHNYYTRVKNRADGKLAALSYASHYNRRRPHQSR
jgi:hypothetical protein